MADFYENHNYYSEQAMFRGKLHKDVMYGRKSHKAMYRGETLLWRRWQIAYQFGLSIFPGTEAVCTGIRLKNRYLQGYISLESIYGSYLGRFEEIGIFGVLENCTFDDVTPAAFDGCVASYYKSTYSYPSSPENYWHIGPTYYGYKVNDESMEFRFDISKPRAYIQFYLYFANKNLDGSRMEVTYLGRFSTKNYCPAIMMMKSGTYYNGAMEISFGRGCIIVFTSNNSTPYDSPFVTDFRYNSISVTDEDNRVDNPYINSYHMLPYGIIDIMRGLTWDREEVSEGE